MKNEDANTLLSGVEPPNPEHLKHQEELKIPLLSFRRSSRAGLWLLLVPLVVAIASTLKYELGIFSSVIGGMESIFSAIDKNVFLTYLIPLLFVGLPLAAMIINLLAFCHFAFDDRKKELLLTIKYRPVNIAVFLSAFAVLVFFLLPDKLSF